jgi:hypothetical protein
LLAFLTFPFSRANIPVCRARTCIRRVDHDNDDEGEHDCRDHPTEQNRQGHYFGCQLNLLLRTGRGPQVNSSSKRPTRLPRSLSALNRGRSSRSSPK